MPIFYNSWVSNKTYWTVQYYNKEKCIIHKGIAVRVAYDRTRYNIILIFSLALACKMYGFNQKIFLSVITLPNHMDYR